MLTSGIVGIIITLVVIGLLLYLVELIPMDRTIKQIIRIIVIIGVVIWLLQAFGLIGSIGGLLHPAHPAVKCPAATVGPRASSLLPRSPHLAEPHIPPPGEAVVPAQHPRNRLGISDVFLLQHPRCQALGRIVVHDGYSPLHHDRAVVHRLIHKVHRASRYLGAELQRLCLRIQSRKRRQQRRMHIQDAVRKRAHKLRAQDSHISRQAHQVHAMLVQPCDHLRIVFRALASCRGHSKRGQPPLARDCQPGRLCLVREHHCDLRTRQPVPADRIRDRDKIRSSPGEQYPESLHASFLRIAQFFRIPLGTSRKVRPQLIGRDSIGRDFSPDETRR